MMRRLALFLPLLLLLALEAGAASPQDPPFFSPIGVPGLRPVPTGAIAGRVVDEEGSPLEEIWIHAQRSGDAIGCGGAPEGSLGWTTTGADGQFHISSLRSGWFEVSTMGVGFEAVRVRQRIAAGESFEGLEIVLPRQPAAGADNRKTDAGAMADRRPRSTPVHGRILLPDGTPVTPDLITIVDVSVHSESGLDSIEIDDRGELQTLVAPGRHEIRVSTLDESGGWPETRVSFEAAEEPVELEIRLSPGSTIFGRVSGLVPRESVVVEIDGFHWPQKIGRNGEDGRYEITRLEAGTLEVKATTQYRSLQQTIHVGTETSHQLDFQFPPAVPVRGRVLDAEGRSFEEVKLSFVQGERTFRAASFSDGSFLAWLEPGSWIAWAQLPERGSPLTPLVPVQVRDKPVEGLQIRYAPPILISGRLLGLEPGEIAHGVWAEGEYPGRFRLGSVDQENEIRLTLPPGTWTLRARRDNREATAVVQLAPGDREATVDLVFQPAEEP